jgi:hypothetical protein
MELHKKFLNWKAFTLSALVKKGAIPKQLFETITFETAPFWCG